MRFGHFLVFGLGLLTRDASCLAVPNDAPYYTYPYVVSLRGTNDNHFCSGSIINEHWIVTAAHCVENRDLDVIRVSAGSTFLSKPHDVYTIEAVIIHEDYERVWNASQIWHDDIALLRTARRIAFNDYVKQTVLPDRDAKPDSYSATIVGWGDTESSRPIPDRLQEIHSRFANCDHIIPSSLSTICTEDVSGVCHNDAGSPVLDMGVQVGISSYTFPCKQLATGVHTRVWYYTPWMSNSMERYELEATTTTGPPSAEKPRPQPKPEAPSDSSSTMRLSLFVFLSAALILFVAP